MRFVVSLVLMAIALSSAKAQIVGTIRYDQAGYGYYYDGSYWLYGTSPYTCTGYVAGGAYYDYCGRYYSSPGYYTFAAYTYPVLPKYSPDWKTKIIAAETQIADIAAFQDAHDKLVAKIPAVRGAYPYAYSNYGYAGSYNSALFGTYGVNTNTVYGYAPNSISQILIDPFGKIDVNQQLLTYQQVVDGVNAAGAAATSNLDKTVNNVVNSDALFSERQARRNSILQAIRELQDPPASVTTSTTGKFGKVPVGVVAPVPSTQPPQAQPQQTQQPASLDDRWLATAQSCAECHFKKTPPDGGWNLNDLNNTKILTRINLPLTHKQHMPPGKMLSDDERQTWAEAIVAAAAARPPIPKIEPKDSSTKPPETLKMK